MAAIFQALYTPHLTQKRKKWYDGQCKFIFATNKVRLSDEEGRILAEQFWTPRAGTAELPKPGAVIAFDRFLVELDDLVRTSSADSGGGKSKGSDTPRSPVPPRPLETSRRAGRKPQRSVSMGPPLEDVLKTESVRVTRPMSLFEPMKRRKYAAWGDPYADTPDNSYAAESVRDHETLGFSSNFDEPQSSSSHDLYDSDRHLDDSNHTSNAEPSSVQGAEHRPGLVPKQEVHDSYNFGAFRDAHTDLDSFSSAQGLDWVRDSDLESEPEIMDVATHRAPRPSMFADVPDNLPNAGPWTKEAYMLFSWHPPVVKNEAPSP